MAKPTSFEEEMEMTIQEKMREYTAHNHQYCMAFLTPVSNPNERKQKGKAPPPQSPPSSSEEDDTQKKGEKSKKSKEDNKANLELLKKLYGL